MDIRTSLSWAHASLKGPSLQTAKENQKIIPGQERQNSMFKDLIMNCGFFLIFMRFPPWFMNYWFFFLQFVGVFFPELWGALEMSIGGGAT